MSLDFTYRPGDRVALKRDWPSEGLLAGAIGSVSVVRHEETLTSIDVKFDGVPRLNTGWDPTHFIPVVDIPEDWRRTPVKTRIFHLSIPMHDEDDLDLFDPIDIIDYLAENYARMYAAISDPT